MAQKPKIDFDEAAEGLATEFLLDLEDLKAAYARKPGSLTTHFNNINKMRTDAHARVATADQETTKTLDSIIPTLGGLSLVCGMAFSPWFWLGLIPVAGILVLGALAESQSADAQRDEPKIEAIGLQLKEAIAEFNNREKPDVIVKPRIRETAPLAVPKAASI